MDPIQRINIKGDSTFALLLEAQKRGHQLAYYTPDRLALLNGRVFSHVESLSVRDKAGDHFTLDEPRRVELTEFDVVLLRQDPPFDLAYVTTTHLLERIHPRRWWSMTRRTCAMRRRRSSSRNFPTSCRRRW
jgi:glutathione synthase